MDRHLKDFYQSSPEGSSRGCFHKVLALHDGCQHRWEDLSTLSPSLPKGWFELVHLSSEDRISFVKEFWLSKFSSNPGFKDHFFTQLDDICVFLVQKKFDDPFDCHMVYSLKDNGGYFKGLPPAKEQDIQRIRNAFIEFILPEDFYQFLTIHDGFSKATDTGIIKSSELEQSYQSFQEMLAKEDSITTSLGYTVNPNTLIPFYESFGMPFFQCFWAEWYPDSEMGNVYFSGLTKTISNVKCADPTSENMAFPTFIAWLNFYLETVE
ncbi:MAG: SMI1/KNR4 family protein [Parachlamydiaceae bacterium]